MLILENFWIGSDDKGTAIFFTMIIFLLCLNFGRHKSTSSCQFFSACYSEIKL